MRPLRGTLSVLVPIVVATSILAMGCDDNGPGNGGATCVKDGFCDTARGETVESCAFDCIGLCEAHGVTGTAHDFLVSELFIPDTSALAKENGVDLDGDGVIDNKLGSIVALLFGSAGLGLDVHSIVNEWIAVGRLLLVARLTEDSFGDDPEVTVQLFRAEVVGDATPLLDGQDSVALDPASPRDQRLCGFHDDRNLGAGPGEMELLITLPGLGPLRFAVSRVRLVGEATRRGLHDVMIGGGILREEAMAELLPAVRDWMNSEITRDASGDLATGIRDLFDDHCDPAVAGCDPLPDGCAPDGVIHLDEFVCHAVLDSAFKPSLDVNDNGVKDFIPWGVRIMEAVPVTVVSQ